MSGVEVRLRRLIDAITAITTTDLDTILRSVVSTATEMVGARYGALGVLSPDGRTLSRFMHSGVDEATAAAVGRPPRGRGVLGRLIEDPRPLRLADIRLHPASVGFPPGHPPMTTFLGVPVVVHGTVYGNLYLAEKAPPRTGGFTRSDEEMAKALAAVAGTVVASDRLRADAQRLAVLEDRDRIAADLHDLVVQRLFAAGLALQASSGLEGPPLEERLRQVITSLDETISDVRTTIFDLNTTATSGGLRRVLREAVAEAAGPARGTLRVAGALETVVQGSLAADLLAVTREAVSNGVRHGRAAHVVVTVDTTRDEVVVQVDDDGTGIGPSDARSGLAGLERRARRRGGRFSVGALPAGGTRLSWVAPLGDGAGEAS